MILLEERKNDFKVFDFSVDSSGLAEYKIEQMKQIPETERIYCAVGTKRVIDTEWHFPFEEDSTYSILSSEYVDSNYKDAFGRTHTLYKDSNKHLLNMYYYYGDTTNKNAYRVLYPEKMKYFLAMQQIYKPDEYDFFLNYLIQKYQMKNIIQLPETLYLLHLLEQEKFSLLQDSEIDISEQLRLFTLKMIDEISKDELRKSDIYGVSNHSLDTAIGRAKKDEQALRLIRKR